MTGQNMKRLGGYIRPVDVRNRDLKVNLSQGICNQKYFQSPKQVAENPETHKIVRTGQFAYNRATTRNGEKISIALREGPDCTVSSAYQVFEVIDENALNPEYLMMWFRRPEFDRLAIYFSHGSAHEFFEWESMCDVQVPIPAIEKQREIVAEYNTLATRIETNKKLIATLEQTAGALYRHTFIDNIDPNNLPSGWRMGTLGNDVECFDYKRKPLSEEERREIRGEYPYYGAISVVDYINSFLFDGDYILFSEDGANIIDEFGHPALQYVWGKFWVNNHAHVLQGNESISTEYLYIALKNVDAHELVTGAAQPKINQQNMNSIRIVVPDKQTMDNFSNRTKKLFEMYKLKTTENQTLTQMQTLLLSKMGA